MCLGDNNMNKKTMKQTKLNLTKDELQWIEEQADIQSSMLMDKFVNLMKIPKENVKEKEMKLLMRFTDEFIKTYTFLKMLRYKLENYRN